MTIKNDNPTALYLHVPFCKSICFYCDFCHVVYQEKLVNQWLDAVTQELNHRVKSTALKTIYLGGGTPTSLNEKQLNRLLSLLHPYLDQVEEYTIEINPETLTEEKVRLMRDGGINRASIGYQAYQEDILKSLGRNHRFEDVENAISLLRDYGITNISLDLMYSLPHQTMEMLEESVEKAISLLPTHLSLYSLTVEENTVFGKQNVRPLSDDVEEEMYEWICKTLPNYGYHQYEISNFCLDGMESKHNLVYWNYEDFYGIGAGASGKENHMRYDHTKNVKEYIQSPLEVERIPLEKEEEMFETIMMGLRLKNGISISHFQETFGIDIHQQFPKLKALIDSHQLVEENGMIFCSERMFPLLNEILVELLPDEIALHG